jgi:hypothetical protein
VANEPILLSSRRVVVGAIFNSDSSFGSIPTLDLIVFVSRSLTVRLSGKLCVEEGHFGQSLLAWVGWWALRVRKGFCLFLPLVEHLGDFEDHWNGERDGYDNEKGEDVVGHVNCSRSVAALLAPLGLLLGLSLSVNST